MHTSPGVKDIVTCTEYGKIRRADGGYFVHYHATASTNRATQKGRYFNSERAALNWLKKQAAK